MKNKVAIIASTDRGVRTGKLLKKEFQKVVLVSTRQNNNDTEVLTISSIKEFMASNFNSFDSFIFIGALGICVRSIAPYLEDKKTDPAVINIDDHGKFAQSVLSGHLGGANDLTQKMAAVLGGQAVITTASEGEDLWPLDTLDKKFGWKLASDIPLNKAIALFVNKGKTALVLEIKDMGTAYLEKKIPEFVDVYYDFSQIKKDDYKLIIAITYKKYNSAFPVLYYHPPVVNIGMGCKRDIEFELLYSSFKDELATHMIAPESVRAIGSADIKMDEIAFLQLSEKLQIPFTTYDASHLNSQKVKNPSEVVKQKLGVYSVAEATAMLLSGNDVWVEKQKVTVASGKKYTWAAAIDRTKIRKAVIAIVGAGPGDPELISVKGKQLLQNADLILYAGSLIPEDLTSDAKTGAVVRNSAGMNLEEQLSLMDNHYAQGHLIVRLHSGDPSIYGAIQEQISVFEEKGMDYFIVPGISSFQAAAAYLKSEFTIPEVVQTIILTRGEGNTPLPEKEKLNEMAKHQATMCIFLSATIAKDVQSQLLEHYPEETPVALLYRVSWKDEEIYRGTLKNLAAMVREHKLTRTVLMIVGVAIGARKNRSQLYHPEYQHIFRTGKEAKIKI